MKFSEYLKDKEQGIVTGAFCLLFFSVMLCLFGLNIGEMVLIELFFMMIILGAAAADYKNKKRRIEYLLSISDSLDQKYLIAEVADRPVSMLEEVYFQMMQGALKSMRDEVVSSNLRNDEYREYIEQWIHEIKVPITGIKLICENNKTDHFLTISMQMERIESDVERVLYYARLGSVEKDYFIREISLKECVLNVLAQNKQYLIQNGVYVKTEDILHNVYSDDKWIEFIIGQIVSNSIKYRSERALVIEFSTKDIGRCVCLSVRDNGKGILQSEISRIFDKGFVGSNGRSSKKSTGIGLYLCSQLCCRLGLDITAESESNRYTEVRLYFPKSGHLNME